MKYIRFSPLFIFLFIACSGSESEETAGNDEVPYQAVEFYGNAQGTTFSVICSDSINVTTNDIDQLLDNFDLALSGYIDSSIVSKLNGADAGPFYYEDEEGFFNRCYKEARSIHRLTGGAFDPTIHPVWTAWDFTGDGSVPDSTVIDSLLLKVGFADEQHFVFSTEKDSLGRYMLLKNTAGARLGFDGIAQGLAVDVLGELLESKGARNYYVEIGGEIRVKGVNTEGEFWRIGIDKPIDESTAENREIHEIIQVDNRSIATSGSYRKFFVQDGIKYSHTIDPRDGYPVKHSLLSATVVAETCVMADGLATAFMVLGAEKSMDFVKDHPELNLDIYLIFENEKGRLETFYTKGLRSMFAE